MKINSLVLENYRSFEKIVLDKFLDINMLFGYNNSGKSNLFKALDLIFQTGWTTEEYSSFDGGIETSKVRQNFWEKTIEGQPFIYRMEGTKKHDITFSVTLEVNKSEIEDILASYSNLNKEYFASNSSSFTIKIEGAIESVGEYNGMQRLTNVSLNNKQIFNKANELYFEGSKTLNHNDFLALMSIFSDCVLLLDNDRYFLSSEAVEDLASLTSKNFRRGIHAIAMSLSRADEVEKLEEFLTSFNIASADSVFSANEKSSPFGKFKFEFRTLEPNGKLELMLRNKFGLLPISSFGTGVQQIIYILSRIFLGHKRKIVLIEEMELNLSPKYQLALVQFIYDKLIQDKKSEHIGQLFFTTHSPLLCYRSEARILQARINDKGKSTIEKLTPTPEEVTALKAAMSILEHYHPALKPAKATAEEIKNNKAASATRKADRRSNTVAPKATTPKKKAVKKKG
jgi:AAA15 family ATPase/GTPase